MDVYSLPWYYTPTLGRPGDDAALADDEWHHARHVMRLQPGDDVLLFDGAGRCLTARMASADRSSGYFTLLEDVSPTFQNPRSYALTLAFAPTRQIDRTETALEKATELGVDRIVLLECDHSERQQVRTDRLARILISAAKQSRKARLPELSGLITPEQWLQDFNASPGATQVCYAHLHETTIPFVRFIQPGRDVAVLIGPEGGFSEAETALFASAGIPAVSLGPFRLRVETAAITACAAVHLLNELHRPL